MRARGIVLTARRWWLRARRRFDPSERQVLFGLTVAIGGACGLVAVAFHLVIGWITGSTIDAAFAVPDRTWAFWVVAVTTGGALAAGVMLHYLPGARGSGIPQVKVAYASKSTRLSVRDSLGKFGIAAVQIGTGSSLGREGPTVQICSGIAKWMGRIAGVSAQNLKLLLPVGSAAGIAAAFNAPIAAVTFTIEEIVGKLDQTLLSGVIVAAALAAVVARGVLGQDPIFIIPNGYGLDHASSLVLYAALGVAAALVSVAFTRSLLWLRARFQRSTRLAPWARPAIGGAVTGVVATVVVGFVGVRGVTGGGYAGLEHALSGDLVVETMLVLGAAKLVATVFAYASGGAGGIFAPSLFLGAMLGGAFGALDVQVFGHGHNEVGSFALVGMGAVFAGIVRAPITSILIIIEMTGGYGLTLPLMISNMVAYGVARHLHPTPIYDALLEQDGIVLRTSAGDALEGLSLAELGLDAPTVVLAPAMRLDEVLERTDRAGRQEVFPVVDEEGRAVGMLTLADLAEAAEDADLDRRARTVDLMRPIPVLRRRDLVGRALELMAAQGVRELPVVDEHGTLLGLIDEAAIAHAFIKLRAAATDPAASGITRIRSS
ncbi:MAG: chloride channel protein [Deltaproteobacteria bacterium]|nr:chloride channel protein [Deltaproteobacteria bacterium]